MVSKIRIVGWTICLEGLIGFSIINKSLLIPVTSLLQGFFIRRSAFQLNFNHSKNLIRPLSNQPKYLLQRTKEKLNRTFSIRRPSNHLPSSVSMENLSTSFLGSPSSKRLSRVFTSFFSPTTIAIKENGNLHHPLGSINDIHVRTGIFNWVASSLNIFDWFQEMSHSDDGNSDDGADNFSLPSTPAPRKKKFQQDSNSWMLNLLLQVCTIFFCIIFIRVAL